MATSTATRSWTTLAALTAAVAAAPFLGCDPPVDAPADDPASAAWLGSVREAVFLPTLAEADLAARDLAAAVTAWRAAQGTAEVDAARLAAQDAWREAFLTWQIAELHQVGPAASSLRPGGRDLRDAIYSWPTVSPCRVDQATAEGAATAPGFVDQAPGTARGLDALEVLLFGGPDNACLPSAPPNSDGRWEALGPDGVQAARADYAQVLADDVVARIAALDAAWRSPETEPGAAMADPGSTGSAYATQGEAVNALYDALYYVEAATKDAKLGETLGLRLCDGEPCDVVVEAPFAGASHEAVAANLVGFRRLFTGGDGPGMDDLLVARGAGDLADAVLDALDAADAAAATLTVPVSEADPAPGSPARSVYDALGRLGVVLKSEIPPVLALRLPQDAAGDND